MTPNDKDIVSALRAALAARVGKDRFELWFGAVAELEWRDSVLTVVTSNVFVQKRLRLIFSDDLRACCEKVFGSPMTLEFRIDAAPAASKPARGARRSDGSSRQAASAADAMISGAATAGAMTAGAAKSGAATAVMDPPDAKTASASRTRQAGPFGRAARAALARAATSSTSATSPAASSLSAASPVDAVDAASSISVPFRQGEQVRPDAAGPQANTPAIARRRLHSLDAFVVGESNRMAAKSVEMVIQQPGRFSPLVLHGPTGVGKTHLLEGLLAEYRRRRRGAAVYLSAEQFTCQFLEAMNGGGLPSFRRKCREVDLLVVDDIHFFGGKKVTLAELLHTAEALARNGAQLALATDRSPAAIKMLGPELSARLQGGMICRIEPPEYATRLGIVRRLAKELGIEAPADVQSYIAQRLTSQSRELAGALKRLHAASLAHDRPISRDLAEETLAELVHQPGRAVRLADIEKAVCEVFGLESESLQSMGKSKGLSHPRMLAMWLARKHTRSALSEIGRHFGRRSHSTVISAQKKIDSWISKGASLSLADRNWTLDEAVRRVEEQMRAG